MKKIEKLPMLVARLHLSQKATLFGLLVLMLVSVLGSLALGRDLNWDFLNYHFYGASLLVEGRLEQDYFAASLQSYLNPLPYVPQYLMIQAGWHSALIGAVLAAVHAVNLVFVALIAQRVLLTSRENTASAVLLATVLALLAPLFLTTSGSSFSDPTTSVAVLAALWLLLAPAPGVPRWRALAAAGILLGIASGLKLTNAVLAVGLALPFVLAWLRRDWRVGSQAMLVLFLAGVVGLVVAHGHWSFKLWQTFGNPFFPLFNGAFGSPDFPAITFRDERFVNAGALSLLALPFAMVEPMSWIYSENIAVDVRFAVLVVVVGLVGIRFAVARQSEAPGASLPHDAHDTATRQRLLLLTAAFLCTYLLWGLSSKIGRYALPLWLLLGPLVMAWAALLLRRMDWLLLFGALLVVVQAYVLWTAGNPRWSPARWAPAWLEVQAPRSLTERPSTLLTLGTQSYSFIVPFLHPETRVSNIVGQYMQPAGERMTPRLTALLQSGPLQVAFRDKRLMSPYAPDLAADTSSDINAVLSSYGLRLAARPCEPMVMSMPIDVELDAFGNKPKTSEPDPTRPDFERMHVCPVEPLDEPTYSAALAAKRAIDTVFDRIEAACGRQLSPHGTETLSGGNGWLRNYFNSQKSVATDGVTVFVRPFRSMDDTALGRLDQWQSASPPACPRMPKAIARP
jgi:hypothetical protein